MALLSLSLRQAASASRMSIDRFDFLKRSLRECGKQSTFFPHRRFALDICIASKPYHPNGEDEQ